MEGCEIKNRSHKNPKVIIASLIFITIFYLMFDIFIIIQVIQIHMYNIYFV